MDDKQLGLKQRVLLNFFTDEVDGKPTASIQELAVFVNCIRNGRQPTRKEINDIHRIVRNLKKRGLVRTWYVTPDKRRIDFKWQPPRITMVALSSYNGPLDVNEEL